MSAFAPTAEQLHIHELFKTRQPIRVRAGAGTGKTTTLIQLAEIVQAQQRAGLYVAFNKSIAEEAKSKFPECISASTAHSLAYRNLANTRHAPLLDRMRRGARIPIGETGKRLKVDRFLSYVGGETVTLTAYEVTRHALAAVDRFCRSADEQLTKQHVGRIPGLDDRDSHAQMVDFVFPVAQSIWVDLQNPLGQAVAFGHSHYLKLFALERPKVGPDGGVIFLDEAQDTSPVLAGIISDQTHLQLVAVGDQAQSIYGFTGATDYMVQVSDAAEGRLTQSWRFGQAVADAANSLLARLGDDLRLTGNPRRASIVDHTATGLHVTLARTNATAIEHVMAAQAAGQRVHLMSENRYAVQFCEDADLLIDERRPAWKKPRLADLAAFRCWEQVVAHANDSADSADWKVLVALIEKHGTAKVQTALGGVVPEAQADLIVSTAHKSKGREWPSVHLADDIASGVDQAAESVRQSEGWIADNGRLRFDPEGNEVAKHVHEWRVRRANDGQTPQEALRRSQKRLKDELMLAYVAATRAQNLLNPGGLIAATSTMNGAAA
ncbi:UvrD-helicase domain-containing protein [Nocardia acidivorans]|uniref:UvrD-helicase domain-containing protein n=1 Tax=Nocardia acidivorans TaxID=404580 RepID=UPI00082B6D88|nr:UvrD-helicase domain-containing protein [Nocardia acidivorans]